MLPHRNVQMLVLKNKIANLWNLKFDRWNDVCDEQIAATVCAKHESEDSAARLSNFTRVLLQFWLQLFQKWLKFRFHWNQRHTHTHTPVMWSRYAMAIKSIILPHIFWRQHLPVNQISLSQKKNFMQKCCFMARDWCFCNHQKTSPAPVAVTHALLSLCLCSFQLNVQWTEQTWVLTSY